MSDREPGLSIAEASFGSHEIDNQTVVDVIGPMLAAGSTILLGRPDGMHEILLTESEPAEKHPFQHLMDKYPKDAVHIEAGELTDGMMIIISGDTNPQSQTDTSYGLNSLMQHVDKQGSEDTAEPEVKIPLKYRIEHHALITEPQKVIDIRSFIQTMDELMDREYPLEAKGIFGLGPDRMIALALLANALKPEGEEKIEIPQHESKNTDPRQHLKDRFPHKAELIDRGYFDASMVYAIANHYDGIPGQTALKKGFNALTRNQRNHMDSHNYTRELPLKLDDSGTRKNEIVSFESFDQTIIELLSGHKPLERTGVASLGRRGLTELIKLSILFNPANKDKFQHHLSDQ